MAGIDELMEGVDVVAVAAVGEVAFSGFALGILEGLMLLYVLILVLVVVMVVEAWGLHVLVLRGKILHVLVVGVWVLHVFVLHIRVLLLGLSLISLCLGRLSPEEIFLLHVDDVVAVVGIDIVAAARRSAVDVGDVDAGETWQQDFMALVFLLGWLLYIQWEGLAVSCATWLKYSGLTESLVVCCEDVGPVK